jgi:hypothetical protein
MSKTDFSDEEEDFEINIDEITVDEKKSTSVKERVPKKKRKFRPIPVRKPRKPKRKREISSDEDEEEEEKPKKKRRKKKKKKKKKKKSKTTILEAAKAVLDESKRSMSGRDIATEILKRKLVETDGNTFHKTVSSQIYVNMRKLGEDSFFEKAKVGKFKKRGAVVEDSETEDEDESESESEDEDEDSDGSPKYQPSEPKHSALSPKRSPPSPKYEI